MFGSPSISQSDGGFARSGSLSHVYIQYPPLSCTITEPTEFYYDDGNKLLLFLSSNRVFSWKTTPLEPLSSPMSDVISEGPVASIRYSLDLKILAVQRSNHEIQFWNREKEDFFSLKCRPESETILGLFWTDCTICDVVVVKSSGLDFLSCEVESKSFRLVEARKVNISWYLYSHESRLVLLASGLQCKIFNGFQLSSAGVVQLPKFEMKLAGTESNGKPVLSAEDIYIVTIYGRIYCLQTDKVAMQLYLHRFYRDAVVEQGSFPMCSPKIAVSVVDNVLLVHQVEANVVILYDIFMDSWAPITAPLPLLLRGFHNGIPSPLPAGKDIERSDGSSIDGHEGIIYGEGWTFLTPDLIFDVSNRFLWRVHLDLEAISSSSSDIRLMLEFLQRRKQEAQKAKQLSLSIIRTAIVEHRPLSVVAQAMDILVTSYLHTLQSGHFHRVARVDKGQSHGMHIHSSRTCIKESTVQSDAMGVARKQESIGVRTVNNEPEGFLHSSSDSRENVASRSQNPDPDGLHSSVSRNSGSQLNSPAVSPDEMYCSLFAPLEEELEGDSSYLVSIIVEFLHSSNGENLKVNPSLHVLVVQLLARRGRFAELDLFVINKVLEPSKEVALQLLEAGRGRPGTRNLGLEMLRQLCLHHDYVLFLLQEGHYLEALRYAHKNKVDTVRPLLFLDAAFASNNSLHLAAVLRVIGDINPGFAHTPDFDRYSRILQEMNSSAVC